MTPFSNPPRILVVTPEVAFIPGGMKKIGGDINVLRKDLADYLADFIQTLFNQGVDVHVTQPDYRRIFSNLLQNKQNITYSGLPDTRVHFAEDRVFFYSNPIDSNYEWENIKISIAFQREVINRIIPLVQPDLIHCHHWMTGLIPAVARKLSIPCLFTVYKPDTVKSLLASVEDMGIDAAAFWQYLFYDRYPANYEETRETNPVNFLLSGILAAQVVSIAGFAYLMKKVQNKSFFTELPLNKILADKLNISGASINNTQSFNLHHYINTYERILQQPLVDINTKNRESRSTNTGIAT
jgi:starch synthase/alpha-amylase